MSAHDDGVSPFDAHDLNERAVLRALPPVRLTSTRGGVVTEYEPSSVEIGFAGRTQVFTLTFRCVGRHSDRWGGRRLRRARRQRIARNAQRRAMRLESRRRSRFALSQAFTRFFGWQIGSVFGGAS